jgi:hypothetical protein
MEDARLRFTEVYVSLSTATGIFSHFRTDEISNVPSVTAYLVLVLASLFEGLVAIKTAREVERYMTCTEAIKDELSLAQYFPVRPHLVSCGAYKDLWTWLKLHSLRLDSIADLYILFYVFAFYLWLVLTIAALPALLPAWPR